MSAKVPDKNRLCIFSVTLTLADPSQTLIAPKKAETPVTAFFMLLNGS